MLRYNVLQTINIHRWHFSLRTTLNYGKMRLSHGLLAPIELKLRRFPTSYAVAMVTCFVKTMTTTCWPMNRHFFVTTVVSWPDIEWYRYPFFHVIVEPNVLSLNLNTLLYLISQSSNDLFNYCKIASTLPHTCNCNFKFGNIFCR